LLLTRHRGLIADYMREHALPFSSLSGKMVAYHMGWADQSGRPQAVKTGKLVRPSLCLWACAALGGELTSALPAAAAIEWFHNFTLVHDDIQDGDRKRHGRETVWSLWGVPQAINAGDAIAALAFLSLARDPLDPGRALRALQAIASAGLTVIEGQCLDLQLERRIDTTLRTYLGMVAAKTGALLGAAMEAGAVIGGADEATAAHYRRAGRLLGTAFQIRDDWLGMYGNSAVTGKSSSGDAARYKMTFPVVARLRLRLDESAAESLTREMAQRYAAKAVSVMGRTGIAPDALEAFEEVAYYVATRAR
jgi:geranylgeranyl diphosphate synthase type I